MKFGPVSIDDAEGAVLAHTLRLPGGVVKKGTVIADTHVVVFRTAGLDEVVVARLEPGDVPEDQAAGRVALATRGEGIKAARPFTGRSNLHAAVRGVLLADRDRLDRLNRVHEGMTVATIGLGTVVEAGDMVGTVKVIPFSLPEDVVAACAGIATEGGPLLAVAALMACRVGLVLTRLPGTEERLLDKAVGVVDDRVRRLGSRLEAEQRCAHTTAAVARAVVRLRDAGCSPIVVFGASAVVDREDVVPAGIVEAGGAVDHFGMPVDPGNLLLLGHLGDVTVIGAPGCARSPAPSGFDAVLARVLAGVDVSGSDLMAMGAGGLLKEIPSRPQPRRIPTRAPRIAGLVLAAGRSERMGQTNKLLAMVDGAPMVRRVAAALNRSNVTEVIVVTGHEADEVADAVAMSGVRVVHNPRFAEGMSTSLRVGLDALRKHVDGVVVALGDMPRVQSAHVDALIERFDPVEGRSIGVPIHAGKRGNPVLWAARYFSEMRSLRGDQGARRLILDHARAVYTVEVEDPGVVLDVDTPDALDALRSRGE